ncbi:MDR family oxidoreductase [Motiliproteus sp. MSK22-1]|uniref:MDR family oxidoreductase n=1 Tax=Motiliproteus sp. MSK22-1 TaxID=1897630 RepID=UPI000976A053|nr:MDR family oxidoreductase [Motiliproteus sp. MSK22-1]OMH39772.1 acryloyl-CoA reductase [Motiliproteus sp. MSK22-1]
MTDSTFNALVLRKDDEGKTHAAIEQLSAADLPDEEVLVKVEYSSLNYKDGMALTGTGKIVHTWPMVPGIDLAGTVVDGGTSSYQTGDRVVLTGWSVGEKYWGGYSQYQKVRPEWLVPLPQGLSTQQSMAVGTAGLTAMLCVMALEDNGVQPADGPVVVSGSAGGVGSVAVALLAKLGYQVAAITGRESSHNYLRQLGASILLSRKEMAERSRPLEKSRWAGAIDTVGGDILARLLAEANYGGCVAACGLAADFKLPTTVMPFILRNVRLQGVDSVMCPIERRTQAWNRLAAELPENMLNAINQVASLEELPELAQAIIKGQVQGRVVVDLQA